MTDHHDPRLREMTYRLIHLAPDAPPFPEVAITTLKPQKTSTTGGTPPGRRNWTALAFAAGAFGLALLVALPILLLRGGDNGPVTPSSTTVVDTTVVDTTAPPVLNTFEFDTTLYFLANYVEGANLPGPHLVPVNRSLEVEAEQLDIRARLGAAIVALLEGPTATERNLVPGAASSIPETTELIGFSIAGTTAELDFNAAVQSGGGTFSMTSRLAQLVYTATALGDVDQVVILIDGEPVTTFSAEGIVLDGPQQRDDYRDLLPLIFVESPLPGEKVESPLNIAGVANTFEAGLQYRVETADGRLLLDGFTTATCGTGCWGDWEVTVDYALAEETPGFVVVFESSAEDGRPVNVVRIPVLLAPAEGSTEGLVTEVYAGLPGGAPLNGAVVVDGTLELSGWTNVTTDLRINGIQVPLDENGAFETVIELTPGENEILIADGIIDSVYTVTYLPGGTVEFAFLERVSADEIVADYAQWLTGEEANRAAIEDGVIEEGDTVPNDYYVRNQNPQLRTLPLADGAGIDLPSPAFGSVINVSVNTAEWLGLFKEDGTPWDVEAGEEPPTLEEPHFGYFGAGYTGGGYWLTLNEAGEVVHITGQYRP